MRLLVLAGTAEGRALAARLAEDSRIDATASLAGATRSPAPYAGRVRVGGFGGASGFAGYLQDERIAAVIDATHPFARVMPRRAQATCARLGLPYLRLLRPGWSPQTGDRWTFVRDAEATAAAIPGGVRVLLATGARSVSDFAGLARGRHLIARVIDPPRAPFPFSQGEWWVARPPFEVEDEVAGFTARRVDVVVAKNAGGKADAKLAAARRLGLPVVLLERPAPPPGDRVEGVAAALAWLEGRL